MEQINENGIVTILPNDVAEYDYTDILVQAERAEKMVNALNKMMIAAIKITTHLDWVIIGGNPYLQESGATKVARLFGISWRILETEKEMDEGYPSYTYRMEFRMGRHTIECEGSRSGRDEFFSGKDHQKSPDAIDALDVKKSAYTNCLNNGIKRMLPGLRNIDLASLEEGGVAINKVRGYTFKTGSRGGNSGGNRESGMVCDSCGTPISQKVASYSEGKYGTKLCMKCQKDADTQQEAEEKEKDDV